MTTPEEIKRRKKIDGAAVPQMQDEVWQESFVAYNNISKL